MTSFAVSHNTSGRVTIDVYGNLRITDAKSYDGGLLECWIRMKKARAVQFIGIAAQYYNLSVALCLLFKILSRIFTSSSPAYKETLDRTINEPYKDIIMTFWTSFLSYLINYHHV